MNLNRFVALTFIAVFSLASGSIAEDFQFLDVFKVAVKGTLIDYLPKHVDMIVANPDKEVSNLIREGGKSNPNNSTSVYFHGVLLFFCKAEDWNLRFAYQAKEGDVIYTYFFESNDDKEKFIDKYKLKRKANLRDKSSEASELYIASPSFLVLTKVNQYVYKCAMHPKIIMKEAGKCPICGMELIRSD